MKSMRKKFSFKKPRLGALKVRRDRSEMREPAPAILALIFESWSLRAGISPEAGMGVSRTGIYTDFT